LDECVPRRLSGFLSGHETKTVPDAGWAGIKNGELLKRVVGLFDVLITVDRNLAFQQNPSSLPVPVIVIHAASNRLRDLQPLVPRLHILLEGSLAATVHHITI
jgi:hypothetical protein